jgi:transposase
MGRVNTPVLTPSQRKELESGLQQGKSHSFRMRCQSILLKSEGRTSKAVGSITGMSHVSVNSWLKRYNSEGISGLSTKPGRGRKPLLILSDDRAAILEAIKSNRQRMRTAKAEWEATSGKSVSDSTFKAFLKSLADDING